MSRKNMIKYINDFFNMLEIWEDIKSGKNYKNIIHQAILEFLKDRSPENATKVYVSFFEAYWIGIQTEKNPFVELVHKINAFEKRVGDLLARQRDHYLHSTFVFILGLAIFSGNKNFREVFSEVLLDKDLYPDAYPTKNEEFFYRWGVASLFHDIAYPLEITIMQANRYLEFISSYPDIALLKQGIKLITGIDNIEEFSRLPKITPGPAFTKEFEKKYPAHRNFLSESFLDLMATRISSCFGIDFDTLKENLTQFAFKSSLVDHCYYGALIVLRWYYHLTEKTRWNPAYFYFPVVDAATAILLHNYYRRCLMKSPFKVGRMNVRAHPIAFLLILCDELQDWNRVEYGEESKCHNAPVVDFGLLVSDSLLDITFYEASPRSDNHSEMMGKSIKNTLCVEQLFADGISLKIKKICSIL
jgi:hypothetical protein